MKHLHMLMVVMTIGFFVYSSFCIMMQRPVGKLYQGFSHLVYLLLIVSGGYLLVLLHSVAGAQYWAYGKIILLIAAIVLMISARRIAHPHVPLIAAWLCILGILVLAWSKPVLG